MVSADHRDSKEKISEEDCKPERARGGLVQSVIFFLGDVIQNIEERWNAEIEPIIERHTQGGDRPQRDGSRLFACAATHDAQALGGQGLDATIHRGDSVDAIHAVNEYPYLQV
jgi:hypothetical protein